MKKIMIAIDGSEHSSTALAVALALIQHHEAQALIVHVATRDRPSEAALLAMEVEFSEEFKRRTSAWFTQSTVPASNEYARTLLSNQSAVSATINSIIGEKLVSDATAYLNRHGVDDTTSLLCEGNPATKIIELINEHNPDCVVMGCRGVGKIRGMVMGSISQAVAHQVDCSVVMVK